MKAILKYPLYRRITPSNRQEALGYLPAGSVVEIAERMVGDKIDGIDSWIKGVDGFHYWEGGVERTPPQLDSAKLLSSFIEEYRLEEFWKRGYDGRNVKVGIIDSHFDKEHPALKNLRYLSCVNLGETNQKHHGSYMASIIGGADYDSGIVGVAPGADFKLVGIGSEGKISVSRFEDALKALGDVDVISMSMTNSSDSFASIETKARFKALLSEKFSLKLFLAAAGNEGDWQGYAKRLYPANFDEVFAVAGFSIATPQVIVNSNFSLSKKNKHFVHHYSGFFDKIQPAVFKNTFNVLPNGTSSSTAFLSGLLTLILSVQNQNRLPEDYILSSFLKRVKVSEKDGDKISDALVLDKDKFLSLLK